MTVAARIGGQMDRLSICSSFWLAASVAFGQAVTGTGGGAGFSGGIATQIVTGRGGTMTMSMPRFLLPAVTGAPLFR